MLELEQKLVMERKKLAELRKQHYHMAALAVAEQVGCVLYDHFESLFVFLCELGCILYDHFESLVFLCEILSPCLYSFLRMVEPASETLLSSLSDEETFEPNVLLGSCSFQRIRVPLFLFFFFESSFIHVFNIS